MSNTTNTAAASGAEDLQDVVSKALRRAWQLGQTYWRQADSDSLADHRRSELTQESFGSLVDETRAALAAPAQAATAKQSPHPEYDKGFSDGWNRREERQAAAPAQAGEYPAGTGNPEADRIIGRLASSDPDFDDCADAVALIHKLVAEIKGPDGFDTWKDAAIADRAAHRAAQAAPVDATMQQDAERWQFFADYMVSTRTDLDDEIVGCDSVQKMARVLDAARAAQKGKHD